MRRTLTFILLAVFLSLGGLPPVPAGALHPYNGHWDDRTITILDQTGRDDYRAMTRDAVAKWNAVGADIQLTYAETAAAPLNETCDQAPGIVPVYDKPDGEFAGVAGYCVLDGHFSAAYIYIGEFHGPQTACHEVGHVLGLGHPTDGSSGPCTPNVEVTEHEGELVRALYDHCTPGDCLEATPTTTTTAVPTTTTTTTAAPPPGSSFVDTAGTTHEASIECLVNLGIANGYGDGRYGPGDSVTRGQMATFIAGALDAAAVGVTC